MNKNASFGSLYAMDMANRLLPTSEQTGPEKQDRVVGVFYFLTHGGSQVQPCNVTKMLQAHPDMVQDYHHPAWGKGPLYWGEPLYGYYATDDPWVLRRHVKLLTMAGVDFLIFDTTNRHVYTPRVLALLEVLESYRKEGWNVPKVAYYTNSQSGATVNEIYESIYKPGLYPDLWFYWEGKPFIVGIPEECTPEQQAFFTFRQPQWPTERQKENACPWIEFQRPQRAWKNAAGENEIVPVSVAQHPNICFGDAPFYGDPSPRGRAFQTYKNDKTPEAMLYGYNVAEQWERAIELDPKMVFFTGWNEWTAGRIPGFADRPVMMIDQADQEYSRDIEPMRGGFFDTYYLQFCDYVRRYKGAPALLPVQKEKTIDIQESFDQWADVLPYWCMPFGTEKRDCQGVGQHYAEDTGRNEFDCVKVAHDSENLYFYARTREDIRFNLFTKWMTLFIGVEGRPYAPHWHGYHYLLNDIVLDGTATILQTCLGGFRFGNNTRVFYRREGREVMFRLPRRELGLEKGPFTLRFKWADHTGRNENIEDFYDHGDSAPYGRFAFIYRGE